MILLYFITTFLISNVTSEMWDIEMGNSIEINNYTKNYLFGGTTSIHKDYAIIGAPLSSKAYIFRFKKSLDVEGDNEGEWNPIAETSITDYDHVPTFGYSVSIGDKYAVISAYEQNSVYVFEKVNEIFQSQVLALVVQTHEIYAQHKGDFGVATAVSGESILIGSNYARKAYIYTRLNSLELDPSKIFTEQVCFSVDEAEFGISVALTQEFAVVGANYARKVYIFHKTNDVWTWDPHALIAIDSYTDVPSFGSSLAIAEDSQDTLLVGAYEAQKVFFFQRKDRDVFTGEWKSTASNVLIHEDQSYFGFSVAVSPDGNAAVVGAPGANLARIFYRTIANDRTKSHSWEEIHAYNIDSFVNESLFGRSVSMHGHSFLVGAAGARKAFLFHRNGWVEPPIKSSPAHEDEEDYLIVPLAVAGIAIVVLLMFGFGYYYDKYPNMERWKDHFLDFIGYYTSFYGQEERHQRRIERMRMLGMNEQELHNIGDDDGDVAVGALYLDSFYSSVKSDDDQEEEKEKEKVRRDERKVHFSENEGDSDTTVTSAESIAV